MKVDSIIIHHSLTKDSGTVSWPAIRNYHKNTCGWRDIGYHYGIELVNNNYEILVGRFEDEDGAHTRSWNRRALGICFVGNYDIAAPPTEMLNKGVEFVRYLMNQYKIKRYMILGHREAFITHNAYGKKYPDKSCPGKAFNMNRFREAL